MLFFFFDVEDFKESSGPGTTPCNVQLKEKHTEAGVRSWVMGHAALCLCG